ncbi:MAG: outer membrane protein assembly factor BamA [Gammaproteobacteria bacterium]|nr:outer membrane protein assembly factor BamA [Gammaproteobacteria bacterium]MBI5617294.1 outer membrane protein assembly factor BamA [Gammaproteobacteria bacterium]
MLKSLAKRWVPLAALLLVSRLAFGVDTFIVDDIRVEGLSRISPGTVFNYLPITVGDKVDDQKVQDAVRALYKTGFFRDVRLERDNDVLVVIVSERESIADITFEGNKAIKTDDLLKGLKDIGFAKGEVYNESKLDKVTQELRRQYYANGKYGVKIDSKVIPIDQNSLSIAFKIQEGEAARIKEINIVGNKVFSDKEILKGFKLTTPNWISWFTKDDQYSKQKLGGDLETMRSLYQDNGYINFTVESTQVSITPDKSDVYITVNIDEGEKFTVGDVKIAGRLIVDEKVLFKLVQTQSGGVFSRKQLTATSKDITDRLGDEGYAFANVNAIPKVDNATKTVAVTYFIDPGQRVYVRRISFVGNAKTRDEVMRREMRQLEGGWISTKMVERSKVRLQRLGYFEEVNVETPAVPGMTDQVDVNFTVKERPSGNLLLGLGFSQSQGLIFNTNVTQDNFLGSGKSVSFAFNNSDINRTFKLGYMNPYWTIDGVSRGFNVGYQETDASEGLITRFTSRTASAGMNFGIPITEYNYIGTGASFEATHIGTNPLFLAPEVAGFIADEGASFKTVRLNASFSYDTRNSAIFPTKGVFDQISAEVAVPGGDLTFYKLFLDSRILIPLVKEYVLVFKGNVGYGDSYGDTKQLPFFENFYGGGPRSVRGFEENSLGPQDIYTRSLGGDLELVGNAELVIPVPFLSEIKSVRLSGFYDAGNIYGAGQDVTFRSIRMSAGLAGMWVSPFGLISVSFAEPFHTQSQDKIQRFQFTFGTTF